MSEIATKILEAREKMNNRGKHWLRGALRRTDPKTKEVSFCSVGAIQEVNKGQGRRFNPKLYHYVHEALPERYKAKPREYYRNGSFVRKPATASDKMNAIIRYNDAYANTWGNVSKLFRKAAKLAERDGA